MIFLAALYRAGRKHVRSGLDNPYRGLKRLEKEPSAALIVPVTGDTPAVRAGLRSLLAQDYPNLRYVFCVADETDPATSVVRSLIKCRQDARLVIAGQAEHCGQKNHNLLAGVASVGDGPEIFVFCDSTHLARPDLSRLLIAPLADGRAVISGGFHRVVPLDSGIGTLGMQDVCLALHCMQPVRAITQPWGGAMAVTRDVFEKHAVGAVWAENIVDDFSMGPHLVKHGIRCFAVADACLETPLKGVSIGQWLDWYTRQLLYLKFCTPEMWLGAIVPIWLFGAAPLMAIGGLAAWLVGLASSWWLVWGLVYLAVYVGVGLRFRTLSPRPVGAVAWSLGFLATFLGSVWCYVRTWTTFTMSWRGISYKVTWRGRVTQVIRG